MVFISIVFMIEAFMVSASSLWSFEWLGYQSPFCMVILIVVVAVHLWSWSWVVMCHHGLYVIVFSMDRVRMIHASSCVVASSWSWAIHHFPSIVYDQWSSMCIFYVMIVFIDVFHASVAASWSCCSSCVYAVIVVVMIDWWCSWLHSK